jgi:hypothetical protein
MLLDDLIDIFLVHVGVPHVFRVDDQNGTLVASVETPRIIDTYSLRLAVQFERLDTRFSVIPHGLRAVVIATDRSGFTLVHTEKYMPMIVAHRYQIFFEKVTGGGSTTLYRNGKLLCFAEIHLIRTPLFQFDFRP